MGCRHTSMFVLSASFVCIAVGQIGCQSGPAGTVKGQVPGADKTFLRQYTGDVAIPDDLLSAYNTFADAARRADADRLRQVTLPSAVLVRDTAEAAITERPEDICLWRLGNRFAPDITMIRKEAEDCYLIQTGSSVTWWVRTANLGWKLYHYLQ